MGQASVNVIRQEANQFLLDLSQANIQGILNPLNVSGDAYQVNLPPTGGSAITITSGAAEVTSVLGSSVLTCQLSAAKAAQLLKGQQLQIDVLLTRSAVIYPIEFRAILNVFDLANQ